MRVHSRSIPYKKPGEKFTLVPFSDLHYGTTLCEKGRFIEMLKEYGRAKNTLLIGNGDYLDCIVSRDGKRFRPEAIDPELMMVNGEIQGDWIDGEVNWFCDIMQKHVSPDNLLGLGTGNHEDMILKYHSSDPVKRIARRLNAPRLGYTWFYHLHFKRPGTGYQRLTVFGHHGFGGGGRTEGGTVTKYCRHAERYEADICLYGHDHDMWVKPIVNIDGGTGRVWGNKKYVIDTGTFMKTHGDDIIPTYPEIAGYPPRNLGYPVIEITTPTSKGGRFHLKGTV